MALIAQYLFNDNANDSSGNGKNGTASNVTYESSPPNISFLGKVSLYNGSNSKIELPTLATANDEIRSIEFNVYQNNVEANQCYFSYGYGGSNRGLRIGYSSDGYLTVWQADDSFATGGIKAATMSKLVWHHIAVTWATGTNNVKIYIDGSLVGQYTSSASDITNEAIGIGVESYRDIFWANAKINNLRYYNDTRSAANILSDYLSEYKIKGIKTNWFM